VAAALVYVSLALTGRSQREVVSSGEAAPQGFWRLDLRGSSLSPDSQELARVLSLPYTAAKSPAAQASGVVLYNRESTSAGVNLYVSGHGPEAYLIDMEGKVLHRWRYPFEEAFPDQPQSHETGFWRRAHPLPNGDLLAIFQGAGLIRLDRDSRLLWRVDLGFYNDLYVAADGSIFGITKDARVFPGADTREPILEDSVVELSPEGELVERISLLECFQNSPFGGLLQPMKEAGDIFHTNTIEVLGDGDHPPQPFPSGSILVSLREVDIIAIVDPRAKTVLQAWRGPWDAQHQPTLLANGNLLIFDNLGAGGLTRVLEFDPTSEQVIWVYPGDAEPALYSPEAGSSQRLPNGNTLITESERGRALEIDGDRVPVWEFLSPHRGGPNQELIAYLFELVRLERAELPFLETPSDG
jgi:hypothetical protein